VKFDVVTIFPQMFAAPMAEGVVARGVAAGLVDLKVHDLRDFTTDRHRVVDDVPYGGGPGMVLKPEPLARAVEHVKATRGTPGAIVLTSPQGRVLTARDAERLAGLGHVAILCGRYEGVDERICEHVATEEISIGDYVLSGGELAAMVIVDAVSRFVPGVVGHEQSVGEDSFSRGLLDYPHYTRPAEFEGWRVPDVLLSGHHAEIDRWRRREALRRTLERRPDLLDGATLGPVEESLYRELLSEEE
jgi:tRNA (guanine37-N1)-methyltransferase